MSAKPDLNAAFKDIVAFFGQLEERAFGPDSVTPTYYISHIGTAPQSQRQGLGGALLRMIKKRASDEGKRLTLLTMTEPNVRTETVSTMRAGADGQNRSSTMSTLGSAPCFTTKSR